MIESLSFAYFDKRQKEKGEHRVELDKTEANLFHL